MTLSFADNVKELTGSGASGTGALTPVGAVSGFRTATAALVDGDFAPIRIGQGTEVEIGIAKWSSGTWVRSARGVLTSSNGGGLVNFSAGVKTISIVRPALFDAMQAGGSGVAAVQNAEFRRCFGVGTDGDLIVPFGQTVTISGNKQYRRVIMAGGTLVIAGVFAKGWLFDGTGGGTVECRGNPGSAGSGGSPGAGGTFTGLQNTIGGADSGAGGAGGGVATNGTASTTVGGVGGRGGTAGDGEGGGAGTGAASGTVTGSFTNSGISSFLDSSGNVQSAFAAIEGGSGGGGGGGASSSSAGGGGGAAGGVLAMFFAFVIPGSVVITVGGRSGGTGGELSTNSSGGGGGGGGGWLIFGHLVACATDSDMLRASGGNGGNAGGSGAGGGNGGDSGRVDKVDCFTDTPSTTTGSAGSAASGTSGGSGATLEVAFP